MSVALRNLVQMAQPQEPAQGIHLGKLQQALAWVEWPKPRIRKDLNPCRRAEAY